MVKNCVLSTTFSRQEKQSINYSTNPAFHLTFTQPRANLLEHPHLLDAERIGRYHFHIALYHDVWARGRISARENQNRRSEQSRRVVERDELPFLAKSGREETDSYSINLSEKQTKYQIERN